MAGRVGPVLAPSPLYQKCGFKHLADKTFELGAEVQNDFIMGRALR